MTTAPRIVEVGKTLALLRQQSYRPAAVAGDLAADNDAARLARSQAPVKQIRQALYAISKQ
jgi:Ni2+-binding GTPase involved in maturation of urease and hydrogenase